MPRKAVDYSKTVIYHFVCQDKTFICSYVGSTTNFVKRKNQHKSRYHTEHSKDHNKKLYQTIRDKGGWANWEMIPLEEFACENNTQQRIREQYWIDKLNPELNCHKAYSTEEDVKEQRNQISKKYYDTHAKEILEQKKQYYDAHSEQIKAYRDAHREQINIRQKAYRLKQKADSAQNPLLSPTESIFSKETENS